MKLWHESQTADERTEYETASKKTHGGDCDCNPAMKVTYRHDGAVEADLFTRRLQLISPCWIQRCGEDRWLVCNPTGTGQIMVVDGQTKRMIEHFFVPQIPAHLQASEGHLQRLVLILWRLGFLLPAGEAMSPHEAVQDVELSAWLHITNACNLRCTYCYIPKTNERMSRETAFQAVDALFRSAALEGYKRIVLKYAGGEASLQMENVISVHDYALQKSRETGIALRGALLTNGIIMTKRVIEQLKQRDIGVTISLDGMGESHDQQRPFVSGKGTFAYVDRSIQRLLAHDMPPHISITVSRSSLAGIPELITYILAQDLTFTMNFYRDNDHAVDVERLLYEEQEMIDGMRKVYRVIEQQLPRRRLLSALIDRADMQGPHRHACGAGKNYLAITQRGGIAPCHMTQEQVVATVADANPLRVLWNDRKGLQNLPVEERAGCQECTWRYWCGGGCPLLTYRMTGRYDRKSPNCHIYQALFPDVLQLEALRLLRYTEPVDFGEAENEVVTSIQIC
jgi:uncharacterized protein